MQNIGHVRAARKLKSNGVSSEDPFVRNPAVQIYGARFVSKGTVLRTPLSRVWSLQQALSSHQQRRQIAGTRTAPEPETACSAI